MARKFYAFPAASGVEINLDPTLITPGAKISEDEIRALVPPGTYIFGSADDAIQLIKVAPTLAMLTPPSLTGSAKIGGQTTITPGTFTAGASVSSSLVYQDDEGSDVTLATDVATYTWLAAQDERAARVVTTATLGADTLVVASPYQTITYNAPTRYGALVDVTYAEDSGDKTMNTAGDFAVVGDAALEGITWSVTGAGATIDTAGVVTITTADARQNSIVTVTATNTGGAVSSAFNVTVGMPVVRFGALTPTGSGGAQARDGSGTAVDITSIDRQPSTRWTLSSGKLVATGSPAMASEQITATVAGASVTISIVVVPSMISVASLTEFNAISMTPAGTGDFTIELRAGVNIAAADANAKIAGTASSPRVLGGKLTLSGEMAAGVPAANIDGKFRPLYFSGGAFVFRDCNLTPTNAADQAYTAGAGSRLIECARSPSTDYTLDGIFSVGSPGTAYGWPGKTVNNGGNDFGHDPWGALVRIQSVTGSFRPYVDGQVGSPDIVTFGTSGVKRVLLGMHHLGGGIYEMQISDKTGNDHSVSNSLVSGEGTCRNIIAGETLTGRDGATAVVMAPPSGVDTAGGYYAGGTGVAYSYMIKGPRWLDTDTVQEGSGVANTCKTLTVRNCRVVGVENAMSPYAIQRVVIEQNSFGLFTQDFLKIVGPKGNPNFELIIRRNDFWGSMQRGSDLGAAHADYIQIFGGSTDDFWKMRIHHNRIFCNRRGVGQGFWLGDNTVLYDSQVFGNILVLEAGGNAAVFRLQSNCQAAHNTVLIYPKEAGLPVNWAPGNGSSMTTSFNSSTPGTDLYVGWNAAHRFTPASVLTEKNFGTNGNTTMAQDALFVGLGATKPSRPWFLETWDEVMVGAKVKLTGADDKAGALGSNSDWSGYPYRVTTDDSHLPFRLDYESGDVS